MTKNISDIASRIEHSYERIIFPFAMYEAPVELAKMAKEWDEDGNPTAYYSIKELANELGDLLVPMVYKYAPERDEQGNIVVDSDGNVVYSSSPLLLHIRWSFDFRKNPDGSTDIDATRDLLMSKGLVDMLADKLPEEVDWDGLVGNEFALLGSYEFQKMPNPLGLEPLT